MDEGVVSVGLGMREGKGGEMEGTHTPLKGYE